MNNIKTRSDRIALIVLGMHRSGTSALAGVLGLLGCDEPATLMTPNEYNEKGYFESGKFYQLHKQLFASAATSWNDWLPMSAGWFNGPLAAEFHERAVETATAEFGESRLFMIKDPRICRLVPFWEGVLAELGATPGYVLTHRNPLEVAASLHKRDGLPVGQGLLIWLRYVLEAEHSTRSSSRCFTSFEQLITNWAGVAEKIQSGLGLNLPRFSPGVASEVDEFIEGSLRHHQESSEQVLHNPMSSVWIRDSYEILERWAISGEDVSDHERLDAIRTAFNASAPAFAQVIQNGHSKTGAPPDDTKALQDVRAKLVATNGIAEREQAARISAEARIAELDDRAQTQFREIYDLSHILVQNEQALTVLRDEIEEHKRKHRRVNEMLDRERKTRATAEGKMAELDDRMRTQFREISDLSHILTQNEQALTATRIQSQADLAEAGALERQLRHEIEALRTSTSWKISAPVRLVGKLINRRRQ